MGILFVISAPSGAGKTTLAHLTVKNVPGVIQSVSHTTRPIRRGETEGVSYHFVAREKFLETEQAGGFIEWVELHGEYYGTSYDTVMRAKEEGRDLILVIDVQGAAKLRQKYRDTVLIFIFPPSLKTLEHRLSKRGTEHQESRERRIEEAKREILESVNYDYLVVNDRIEDAADEIAHIIHAERCRVGRRARYFPDLLAQK
ncbi:MAG: guanylate kinase [Nitrospinae bacterium]|nr:guanylate kinase [Nitrospinota bacterium]